MPRTALLTTLAGRLVDAGPVAVIAAGIVVVGSILAGGPATPTLVAAQGLLPYLGLAVVGAAVVAAVRRRRSVVVAGAVVSFACGMLVVPTMTARSLPSWASGAHRLVVFSANVRYDNPQIGAALAAAKRSDADVIVLNEFVPAFDEELRTSGLLETYPTVVRDRVRDGNVLLTRLPATSAGLVREAGIELPSATVRVGGTDVRVAAVHTQAPHSMRYVGPWRRQVAGVAQAVAGHDEVIAVGDFNSTIWNVPFRRLLGWGFVDAHDAVGDGTDRTWGPTTAAAAPAVLGIDHAMSRGDRIAPLAVTDGAVPGSDHRSITVTYAVR